MASPGRSGYIPVMGHDVIIIGAGVAGLSCARVLRRQGSDVLVLNSGRSVGGRCSTWRAEADRLLDYGTTFFHGQTAAFLDELSAVDATIIPDWPRRIVGTGPPCQPNAFSSRAARLAFREGVSVLPKHLAAGTIIKHQTKVTRIVPGKSNVVAIAEGNTDSQNEGERFEAKVLVIATANSQANRLLDTIEDSPEKRALQRLLRDVSEAPCLSLLCSFDGETPPLDWDMMYPDLGAALQLVSNEGAKRPGSAGASLVLQARPNWSREHIEERPEAWEHSLLEEAKALVGGWVTKPTWTRPHRWEYARTNLGTQLSSPVLLPVGNAQIGLCGELYSREGGVEASYLSGIKLAKRIAGSTT